MKKIINGKVYDTNTAREMGMDCGGDGFSHWCERLYQKRTGEFFLHGEGGPMTKYARTVGQNSWTGGEQIMPLSVKAAREWVEEHLDADDYEKIFGLPDEDAEDAVLYAKIPAQLMARLKARAAEESTSVTELVCRLLEERL